MVEFTQRFEATGLIDGVADDGVVEALGAAHVADHDVAGLDADAGMENRQALGLPVRPLCAQGGLHRQRGFAGAQRMLFDTDWRIPEGHDGVTDEFVDGAAHFFNDIALQTDIFAQMRDQGFGTHLFGDAGKADDI